SALSHSTTAVAPQLAPLSLHDALPIFRRDAQAGVGDGDQGVRALGAAREGDRPALRRVLHSVVHEVADNLHEPVAIAGHDRQPRSEEHTSELQSPYELVCRLLLEKKKE